MNCLDGFVSAVWTVSKHRFLAYACDGNNIVISPDALRVLECWADDVPSGKWTSFCLAEQATDDEAVMCSW